MKFKKSLKLSATGALALSSKIYAQGSKQLRHRKGIHATLSTQGVDEVCPCSSPSWKNHGDYMSCVTKAVKDLGIDTKEQGLIKSEAAKSDCGKETDEPPNISFGLFVSPRHVISGQDTLLTFQVIPEEPIDTELNPVQLYLSKNEDEYLGAAVDNGSASSGDKEAGDGIFTNAFSFNFPPTEMGTLEFKAVIGPTVYTYSVSVIKAGSVVESTIMEDMVLRYQDFLYNGNSYDNALEQLHDYFLMNLPAHVHQEDVVLTLGNFPSLSWTTAQGLTEAIAPGFPFLSSSDWEPIAFGDTLSIAPESLRKLTHTKRMDEEDSPLSQCLKKLRGIGISLHGMQKSNFLGVYGDENNMSVHDYWSLCSSQLTLTPKGSCVKDPLSLLRSLHFYQAVSIVSPARPIDYNSNGVKTNTVALFTDVPFSLSDQYEGDIADKRVMSVNGYLAVTPAFFEEYIGYSPGGAIYIGGSESSKFVQVFSNKGFVAFGHPSFWRPLDTWVSLFSGNIALNTPCIGDGHCVMSPSDSTYSFMDPPWCTAPTMPTIPNLVVSYTWPQNEPDLDTGTEFLGHQVGYGCENSPPYMNFSGDNTNSGGTETVVIDLQSSLDDGMWSIAGGVVVDLKAGWYSPSGGVGPATVTVQFEDVIGSPIQYSINPGSQSGCSSTCIGSVFVSVIPQHHAQVSIGSSSCGVIPFTPEKSASNECEQTYYDLVDFNPSGYNEYTLAVLEFLNEPDIPFAIKKINDDAYKTSIHADRESQNAFTHAYFNYQMTMFIRNMYPWNTEEEATAWAKKWGDAHERTAINPFSERIQDLMNNIVGRRLAIEQPKAKKEDVIAVIKNAIADGLLIIDPLVDACGCETGDGRFGTCVLTRQCEELPGKTPVPYQSGDPEPNCKLEADSVTCCVDETR